MGIDLIYSTCYLSQHYPLHPLHYQPVLLVLARPPCRRSALHNHLSATVSIGLLIPPPPPSLSCSDTDSSASRYAGEEENENEEETWDRMRNPWLVFAEMENARLLESGDDDSEGESAWEGQSTGVTIVASEADGDEAGDERDGARVENEEGDESEDSETSEAAVESWIAGDRWGAGDMWGAGAGKEVGEERRAVDRRAADEIEAVSSSWLESEPIDGDHRSADEGDDEGDGGEEEFSMRTDVDEEFMVRCSEEWGRRGEEEEEEGVG